MSVTKEPVISVELDFEFDKSEELCRAIEDAYEDVHGVLDIWKKEFQMNKILNDSMYFSDFLSRREEFYLEMNQPADQELNFEAFFDWLDSKDTAMTSLQQMTQADISVQNNIDTKVSFFHKRPDAEDLGTAAALYKIKAPVSLNVPSRHTATPSRLLQRLGQHNKTLAYDYDDIFDKFGDAAWDDMTGHDMESEGSEADVEELRQQHLARVRAEEEEEVKLEHGETNNSGFSIKKSITGSFKYLVGGTADIAANANIEEEVNEEKDNFAEEEGEYDENASYYEDDSSDVYYEHDEEEDR